MSEHEKKSLLKIVNLSKNYNNRIILNNVNFDVYEGEILALLGLSGSGKSTLLKIMCGFVKQDSGKVSYDRNFRRTFRNHSEIDKIRSLFGFSSQDPSFYPQLSVLENLEYFGTLLNIDKVQLYQKIDEVLKTLDLFEMKEVLGCDLSEGMKKRLDIACSIIHSPKILILDEPTANLDFRLREELLNYIKKINKSGMTIIFVSHYVEEVEMISNRVAILSNSDVETVKNNSHLKQVFANKVSN